MDKQSLDEFNAWFQATDFPGSHIEAALAGWEYRDSALIEAPTFDTTKLKQVHIDLETLDVKSTAYILSIGAVFGAETFYEEIDQPEYAGYSQHFTESQATADWWAKQGGYRITQAPMPPYAALSKFSLWFERVTGFDQDVEVWANSPSFDCSILRHHFNVYNLAVPWQFYQEADVRTIKKLYQFLRLPIKAYKNPHNALLDAQNQRGMVTSVFLTLAKIVQAHNSQLEDRKLDLLGN